MILDSPLTEEQCRLSKRNYNLYCLANGASYMCLGETVISLLAIKLEAPNVILAAIGAMLNLGFLMLPLGPLSTARIGAAQTVANFWVCRNVSALLVAASVFVNPFSQHLAWGILLLGSFLFYGFRAAGVVMGYPLIGEFTTEEDRPKLLGDSNAIFYSFGLISLITITLLLRWNNSPNTLVCIICVGSSIGVTASMFFRKIHETTALRDSARTPLLPQLIAALHNRTLRAQIYAGFMFNLGKIILFAMSLTALKRGCGVSDSMAVIFSSIQFFLAIIASKLIAPAMKHLGIRRFAILDYLLIVPCCLFWLLLSPGHSTLWHYILYAVPFLLSGSYEVFYTNILTQYFLNTISEQQRVACSMFINIVTGVAASLIGMAIAALLLKWATHFYGEGFAMFKAYFTAGGILLIGGLAIMFMLPRGER